MNMPRHHLKCLHGSNSVALGHREVETSVVVEEEVVKVVAVDVVAVVEAKVVVVAAVTGNSIPHSPKDRAINKINNTTSINLNPNNSSNNNNIGSKAVDVFRVRAGLREAMIIIVVVTGVATITIEEEAEVVIIITEVVIITTEAAVVAIEAIPTIIVEVDVKRI